MRDCREQSRDDSRAPRWLLTARQEQSHGELLAQVLRQQNCSRGFASCSETCSRSAVITSPRWILFDKHVIYDGIKKGMLPMLSLLSLSDDSMQFCRRLPALRGNWKGSALFWNPGLSAKVKHKTNYLHFDTQSRKYVNFVALNCSDISKKWVSLQSENISNSFLFWDHVDQCMVIFYT